MTASAWSIVDQPGDPIPDDPAVIEAQVSHLRSMALAIRTASTAIPASDDAHALTWDSDAATSFRTVARNLPVELTALVTRYDGVANALSDLGVTLVNKKAAAAQALFDAKVATDRLVAAKHGQQTKAAWEQAERQRVDRINEANGVEASSGLPTRLAMPQIGVAHPQPWTGPDWDAEARSANRALDEAKKQVREAATNYHVAASSAATRIAAYDDDALRNAHHGLWDKIKGVANKQLDSAARTMAKHASLLNEIANVASSLNNLLSMLAAVALVVPALGPLVDVALAFGIAATGTLAFAADVAVILSTRRVGDKRDLKHDLLTAATDSVGLIPAGKALPNAFRMGRYAMQGKNADKALRALGDSSTFTKVMQKQAGELRTKVADAKSGVDRTRAIDRHNKGREELAGVAADEASRAPLSEDDADRYSPKDALPYGLGAGVDVAHQAPDGLQHMVGALTK